MEAHDKALVALFECLEAYLEVRERLNAAIKDGHFHLARSKYNMGSLGQQQYPADMRACAWVSMQPAGDAEAALQLQLQAGEYPRPLGANAECGESSDDDLDAAISQELSAAAADDGLATSAAAPRRASRSGTEAITWFGGLPPQSLKQAQTAFSDSTGLAVQAANLAAQLQSLAAAVDALQQQA